MLEIPLPLHAVGWSETREAATFDGPVAMTDKFFECKYPIAHMHEVEILCLQSDTLLYWRLVPFLCFLCSFLVLLRCMVAVLELPFLETFFACRVAYEPGAEPTVAHFSVTRWTPSPRGNSSTNSVLKFRFLPLPQCKKIEASCLLWSFHIGRSI